MKNLHVFQTVKLNLDAIIVGQCIDADNGRILVLTKEWKVFEVQGNQLNDANLVKHDLDIEAVDCKLINPEDVILVEFIVEDGSILVALKNGQVIRIGVSSFSPASCEIYKHSKCVSSIKLSPDQDLIALADGDNDIFILSSDWMHVYSSNALTENESVHKPVGVGWGSKETQFFGLDGRPSKEKQSKNQVVVNEDEVQRANEIEQSCAFDKLCKSHERSTVIDWRGDGQFLATLTFIPDSGKHYLKVWNRNLELQYMSEQLVTMERGLLSWIPNGQYVCCAQRRDIRVNEIAMFEKNGMVHQRVSLPTILPHLYIKELLWSPDSKILAIIVAQFATTRDTDVKRSHMIMLYTMQNFQYYLKYSSCLSHESDYYSMRWNPIHHNMLYVTSDCGQCLEYNCSFNVDHCKEESTVVVSDANKLLLTPFSICNIPPPMSAIELKFSSLITRLIVDTNTINRLFVLTSDDKLFYTTTDIDPVHSPEIETCINSAAVKVYRSKLGTFKSTNLLSGQTYQNLISLNEQTLLATRQNGTNCEIYTLDIADSEIKTTKIRQIEQRQVLSIVKDSYNATSNSICLLLDDSKCMQLNLSTSEILPRFLVRESNERLYIKEAQYIARYDVVMTLTIDLTLRINQHVITSNCTSFKISENFLIYTTNDHMINFLPLDRVVSSDKQSELGSWNQPIENDGTLVLVSEDDSKVILQMPRGNLEILHPRIMVLLRITNYLDACDYMSAMKLARRYRVDLNFLCDYLLRCDEKLFYDEKLNSLASAIAREDPSLLNLLITELSPEDTTRDRYASAMKYLPARTRELENKEVVTLDSKVNKICSSISLPENNRYLQPRLLCLLKQEPRKTDEALEHIHALNDKDEKDAALKFILYFVHVDQLFLDAISTHNTDIALMVASISSKDPKEYLALLDGFKAIENPHLRQHKMDMHIKNYERAFSELLNYLHDSQETDITMAQLIDLMVSKRIYKHAIQVCSEHLVKLAQISASSHQATLSELTSEILTRYGDYLLEKRYYMEAGLAYGKSIEYKARTDDGKELDNVLKCYLLAGEWERCLAAIERYGLESPKREDVLSKISNNLLQQGDKTTAILVMQLRKDNRLASQLVDRSWHLADALSDEHNRDELLLRIQDAIIDAIKISIADLETELYQAKSQFERLKELIMTPQKTDHFDAENCFTSDSLSTVDGSEMTSVITGSRRGAKTARSGAPSIATRTSSKFNKSQAIKKKKINLKVGSRHEDMALVLELQTFIGNQKTRQDCARDLLAALIEYIPLASQRVGDFQMTINKQIKERYQLAKEICNVLWPQVEREDDAFSLYKRFGKIFLTEEVIDNTDVKLLLRPDYPSSLILLEF